MPVGGLHDPVGVDEADQDAVLERGSLGMVSHHSPLRLTIALDVFQVRLPGVYVMDGVIPEVDEGFTLVRQANLDRLTIAVQFDVDEVLEVMDGAAER